MTDAELIAEVARRPNVLWALVTSSAKVAGPWVRNHDSSWRAAQTIGHVVVMVHLNNRPNYARGWLVSGHVRGDAPFEMREAAEAWADTQLHGWHLASELKSGINNALSLVTLEELTQELARQDATRSSLARKGENE